MTVRGQGEVFRAFFTDPPAVQATALQRPSVGGEKLRHGQGIALVSEERGELLDECVDITEPGSEFREAEWARLSGANSAAYHCILSPSGSPARGAWMIPPAARKGPSSAAM